MNARNANVILILLGLALAACGGAAEVGQSGGAIGPQQIADATEVLRFDPASVPAGEEARPGVCVESTVAPGAYRCELAAGGAAEPCFALSGVRLLCDPEPVAKTYVVLVSPQNALPSVSPPSPDQAVPFFVELDGGLTCAIRTAPEPVVLDGVAATYDCDTPYTYLVGEDPFDRNAPTWRATIFTLDPAAGQATAGESAGVLRAWIP